MADEFPSELKQFIDQHIESLAELETLLFLRRESERPWSADEIAKILYIPSELASSLLADLQRKGFAVTTPEGAYLYKDGSESYDRLIDQLTTVYHDRRVAVISLIYSKPLNRVQTFADAFRFWKGKLP